ncbi:hypothetical protein HDU96_001905 [Phlyctochytrium bullatum]|nr:hypothetical protein HDU96_001905 [Phlyctochytrium bullatum]
MSPKAFLLNADNSSKPCSDRKTIDNHQGSSGSFSPYTSTDLLNPHINQNDPKPIMATPAQRQLVHFLWALSGFGSGVIGPQDQQILNQFFTAVTQAPPETYGDPFNLIDFLSQYAPWALPFLPPELQPPPEPQLLPEPQPLPAADALQEEVEGLQFLGHEEFAEANDHAGELVDEGFFDDEVFEPVQQEAAEVDALQLAIEMDPAMQQWLLGQVQGQTEEQPEVLDFQLQQQDNVEDVEEPIELVQPTLQISEPHPEQAETDLELGHGHPTNEGPHWYVNEPDADRPLQPCKRLRDVAAGGAYVPYHTKKRTKLGGCSFACTVEFSDETAYADEVWPELHQLDAEDMGQDLEEQPASHVLDANPVGSLHLAHEHPVASINPLLEVSATHLADVDLIDPTFTKRRGNHRQDQPQKRQKLAHLDAAVVSPPPTRTKRHRPHREDHPRKRSKTTHPDATAASPSPTATKRNRHLHDNQPHKRPKLTHPHATAASPPSIEAAEPRLRPVLDAVHQVSSDAVTVSGSGVDKLPKLTPDVAAPAIVNAGAHPTGFFSTLRSFAAQTVQTLVGLCRSSGLW